MDAKDFSFLSGGAQRPNLDRMIAYHGQSINFVFMLSSSALSRRLTSVSTISRPRPMLGFSRFLISTTFHCSTSSSQSFSHCAVVQIFCTNYRVNSEHGTDASVVFDCYRAALVTACVSACSLLLHRIPIAHFLKKRTEQFLCA